MFDDDRYATVAIDAEQVSRVLASTPDSPSILFSRKYADVAALSSGDIDLLRPVIDENTAGLVATMDAPAHGVSLVFGANGFVGAHLVAELSLRPQTVTVYAGVRSTEGASARERFEATVEQYSILDIDMSKIVVIEAVPTLSQFGLDEERYLDLRRTVDQVYNSASSTDYESTYLELRADWFESLLRVLQFTLEDRRKHLTYMGSVGAYLYTDHNDFRRPDSWWYSGYCQMKWVNARLLGWLAEDGVASVTLCEAPYVLGTTTAGKDPGRVYSFWRTLEVCTNIGVIWDGPGMNYTPVDVLCRVLVDNAVTAQPATRLLPSNPEPYSHALFAELLGLELVPWERFLDIVHGKIPAAKTSSLLGSDVNDLINRTNAPSRMTADFDVSWWDHRKLFTLYLSNIEFRDFTARRPRLVTA